MYFVANWKMYGSLSSLNSLNKVIKFSKSKDIKKGRLIYCPPFTLIDAFSKKFKNEFKSIEALFSLLHNNREERYKQRFSSLLTHIAVYSCEKTRDKNAARLLRVTHHHTLLIA